MREAGRLLAGAMRLAGSMMQPGVKTIEIDAAIERLFVEYCAVPLFKGAVGRVPFPSVTCVSINEEVCHGIPGGRELENGDIVSVDTGCRLAGWCCDAAWTYPVGEVTQLKRRLLEAGEATLRLAIREMGWRQTWGGVVCQMEQEVKRAGFYIVEDVAGHGIGRELHEDPQVVNVATPSVRRRDFRLERGLVLAIEPALGAGTGRVRRLANEWTLVLDDGSPSVHFEHTVALNAAGPEVLTADIGISERF